MILPRGAVRSLFTIGLSLAAVAVTPARAQEPNAYPITNVNLRAGPGTEYPVIVTVPTEEPITILGCLPDYTWCDTVFANYRGWMRSIYLSGYYEGEYYLLRDYAPDLGYQPVTFNITAYWGSYYRNEPFYGELNRWATPRGPGYVSDSAFYGRLAPYGSWTWIQGQYVWVPARVDRSWRPYTRGRWVYTDRGWTWVSSEPFGWATYHYGRWGFSDRVGWFWVPGNHWAPAWVSWRQSDDYLGWAPLPPQPNRGGLSINISIGSVPDYYWNVVPSRDFLSDDLPRYYVDGSDRRRPFFQRSRDIGHTTVINNNVTVNKVVNVNYVEQKTERKVVTRNITRTKNVREAGRLQNKSVDVYQPTAAEAANQPLAPPETKPVGEIAKASETKQQANGEATTEANLAPPEVNDAVKKRKGKRNAANETPSSLNPALPKGKEADAPPPGGKKQRKKPVPAQDIQAPQAGGEPQPTPQTKSKGKPEQAPAPKETETPAQPKQISPVEQGETPMLQPTPQEGPPPGSKKNGSEQQQNPDEKQKKKPGNPQGSGGQHGPGESEPAPKPSLQSAPQEGPPPESNKSGGEKKQPPKEKPGERQKKPGKVQGPGGQQGPTGEQGTPNAPKTEKPQQAPKTVLPEKKKNAPKESGQNPPPQPQPEQTPPNRKGSDRQSRGGEPPAAPKMQAAPTETPVGAPPGPKRNKPNKQEKEKPHAKPDKQGANKKIAPKPVAKKSGAKPNGGKQASKPDRKSPAEAKGPHAAGGPPPKKKHAHRPPEKKQAQKKKGNKDREAN